MGKDLATWANTHITKYTPDRTIEDDIMRKTQVPANILDTHKVNLHIENMMKKKNKKEHVFDTSLARLQKKTRDIFGPLAKVWEVIHAVKEGDLDIKD